MSDPVHLDLPEPGRSLFIRVADVLERKLPAIMPAGANWQLGGGTVLAAQWGHRLSTDVDIMLPHTSNFSAYMPGRDDSLTDEMERLGATRLDVPANTLKYTFPNGRVELTAMDPTPAVPSRTAHSGSTKPWVNSPNSPKWRSRSPGGTNRGVAEHNGRQNHRGLGDVSAALGIRGGKLCRRDSGNGG